jgi:hypothetical protein
VDGVTEDFEVLRWFPLPHEVVAAVDAAR